jgi:hypothetical protein
LGAWGCWIEAVDLEGLGMCRERYRQVCCRVYD